MSTSEYRVSGRALTAAIATPFKAICRTSDGSNLDGSDPDGSGRRVFPTRFTHWRIALAAALSAITFAATGAATGAQAFSRTIATAGEDLGATGRQSGDTVPPIPHTLLQKALIAYQAHADKVEKPRYLTIADFSRHSSEKRMFILDMETGTHEALLVAHGQGSDEDHDGYADIFSNEVDSHMSSVGAYVTGPTYYGKHGLSLRLLGLEETNDRALERAIVVHGADYVDPTRDVLGRSWGCPAIEPHLVEDVVPRLANGTFFYISG